MPEFPDGLPHCKLLQEAAERLRGYGIDPVVITSDTHPDAAIASILEFLETAKSNGTLLLITQQAYFALPWFPRRDNWQIIIDEIPKADSWHGVFFLPREHQWLADQLEARPWRKADLVWIRPRDEGKMKRQLEKPQDDKELPKPFRELMKELINPNKRVFMMAHDWRKLSTGEGFSRDDDEPNAITFVSMLRPQAFQNAIVMGANFEQSLLYLWLTRTTTRIGGPCEPIAKGLPKLSSRWSEIAFAIPVGEQEVFKGPARSDDNFAKQAELSGATLGISTS